MRNYVYSYVLIHISTQSFARWDVRDANVVTPNEPA